MIVGLQVNQAGEGLKALIKVQIGEEVQGGRSYQKERDRHQFRFTTSKFVSALQPQLVHLDGQRLKAMKSPFMAFTSSRDRWQSIHLASDACLGIGFFDSVLLIQYEPK